MREIKFRLWSDSLKVMYSPDNKIPDLWSIHEADNGIIKVDKGDILMQFIGLLDKNGKEIYEGDIIKIYGSIAHDDPVYGYYEPTGEVIYHNERASFILHDNQNFNELLFERISHAEIIGNIYENPELLS